MYWLQKRHSNGIQLYIFLDLFQHQNQRKQGILKESAVKLNSTKVKITKFSNVSIVVMIAINNNGPGTVVL